MHTLRAHHRYARQASMVGQGCEKNTAILQGMQVTLEQVGMTHEQDGVGVTKITVTPVVHNCETGHSYRMQTARLLDCKHAQKNAGTIHQLAAAISAQVG